MPRFGEEQFMSLPKDREAQVGDWRGANLLISRGQKDRKVGGRERGTKKRRGAKLLPVPPGLAEWLERYVPAERRLAEPDAYLFRNPDAYNATGQWSEAAMRRTWYSACGAVGVAISLYEGSKHSTGTALKTAGADDRVLARLFGHSDTRSVERYAKIQTEVIRSTLARLPGRQG